MINFTYPIDNTLEVTKPNVKGTGTISLEFGMVDDEIEEMKERALMKTEEKIPFTLKYEIVDCRAYVEVTQNNYNVKGKVTACGPESKIEYSDVRLSEEEKSAALEKIIQVIGGKDELASAITHIQSGAERDEKERYRDPEKEKIKARIKKLKEREMER